tara:strand:+ start:344 stop:511 length:168 start_codon:yes stop_codon:yes gene_type:complete
MRKLMVLILLALGGCVKAPPPYVQFDAGTRAELPDADDGGLPEAGDTGKADAGEE